MARNETRLVAFRKAVRAVDTVEHKFNLARASVNRLGFPFRAPTIPHGVDVPAERGTTGADFDTDWARRPSAKLARRLIVSGPMRRVIGAVADPEITGLDRLADLKDLGNDAPSLIFVANHHSHLDAPLMLTSIPLPWRDNLVVGAAADYFFGTRLTGAVSALALGAFPIDRHTVNRRSSDLASELINDGWSLLIFPEGGRSPDGWGQTFKGGAAFLSEKCNAPVVPVHIDGSGSIWGKGSKKLKPGKTKVTFGRPLTMVDGENVRRFNERIERAVAELADEAVSDWWSARQRAGSSVTPSLTGPAYTGWRRAWALSDERAKGKAGEKFLPKRRWPSTD